MRKAIIAALLMAASFGAQACEDGHWVQSVSQDGKVVILEDRSVWIVDAMDRIDTILWLPMTDVVACEDQLISVDDGEVVGARRVR